MSFSLDIEAFLARRFVFHCSEAGVRLRDDERRSIDVEVFHRAADPNPDQPSWAPPALRVLYDATDGVWLFCPQRVDQEPSGADYGFIIFPTRDVEQKTEEIRKWAFGELAELVDDLSQDELDSARTRVESMLSIGTSVGGNPVMLDLSWRDDAGEPAVVMLNHEMLVGNLFAYATDDEEGPVVWPNVSSFLADLEQEPMRYLEADWRFHDNGDGRQYFVDSISPPST